MARPFPISGAAKTKSFAASISKTRFAAGATSGNSRSDVCRHSRRALRRTSCQLHLLTSVLASRAPPSSRPRGSRPRRLQNGVCSCGDRSLRLFTSAPSARVCPVRRRHETCKSVCCDGTCRPWACATAAASVAAPNPLVTSSAPPTRRAADVRRRFVRFGVNTLRLHVFRLQRAIWTLRVGLQCVLACPACVAGSPICDIVFSGAAGTPVICPVSRESTCGAPCP